MGRQPVVGVWTVMERVYVGEKKKKKKEEERKERKKGKEKKSGRWHRE